MVGTNNLKQWGVALIVGASLLMASSPGLAQVAATNPPQARGLILRPLTLTRIQNLDFGTLIPSATSGSVSINATTGARTTFGGVTGLPSAMPRQARFGGAGTPGQQVLVMVVPPAVLTNSVTGDTIDVLAMPLDGSPVRTISAERTFFVGVGGVISIAANQPDGVYSAEFEVIAQYQ